jgi:hypothetical protein
MSKSLKYNEQLINNRCLQTVIPGIKQNNRFASQSALAMLHKRNNLYFYSIASPASACDVTCVMIIEREMKNFTLFFLNLFIPSLLSFFSSIRAKCFSVFRQSLYLTSYHNSLINITVNYRTNLSSLLSLFSNLNARFGKLQNPDNPSTTSIFNYSSIKAVCSCSNYKRFKVFTTTCLLYIVLFCDFTLNPIFS